MHRFSIFPKVPMQKKNKKHKGRRPERGCVIDPVLASQPRGEDFSFSYSFSCLFFFLFFGSADMVLHSQDWVTLFSRCSGVGVQPGE